MKPPHVRTGIPTDDDEEAESDVEDDLEDLDDLDMGDDEQDGRREKAKYMKVFVSVEEQVFFSRRGKRWLEGGVVWSVLKG